MQLDSTGLLVQVLHKPLGSGGRWVPIEADARIRVPPQGKPVRLVARCVLPGAVPLWETLDFTVKNRVETIDTHDYQHGDVWESLPNKAGFQLVGTLDSEPWLRTLAIKLLAIRKIIIFHFELQCSVGNRTILLTGQSVAFSTTNSGQSPAQRKPKISTFPKADINLAAPPEISSLPTPEPTAPVRSPIRDGASNNDQEMIQVSQFNHEEPNVSEFYADGSLNVEGHLRSDVQYSDERLKEHIEDLNNASDIIQQLRGVTFRWKQGSPQTWSTDSAEEPTIDGPGRDVIGFIAQEVAQVVPEIVQRTKDGYLTVAYAEMVPILIEALKEHAQDLLSLRQIQLESSDMASKISQIRTELESISSEESEVHDEAVEGALLAVRRNLMSEIEKKKNPVKARKKNNEMVDIAGVSVIKIPSLPKSTPPSSRSKKGREGTDSMLFSTSKIMIILGVLLGMLVLGCIVVFAVGFTSRQPVPGPTGPPTSFNTTNYIENPDFEDPSQYPRAVGWAGSYYLLQYAQTQTEQPDGPLLQSQAQFPAGNFFLYMNSTPSTTTQMINMTQRESEWALKSAENFNLTGWCYVSTVQPASAIVLGATLFMDNLTPFCTLNITVDSSRTGWQYVWGVTECMVVAVPAFVEVSFHMEGAPGATVAWDHVSLWAVPPVVDPPFIEPASLTRPLTYKSQTIVYADSSLVNSPLSVFYPTDNITFDAPLAYTLNASTGVLSFSTSNYVFRVRAESTIPITRSDSIYRIEFEMMASPGSFFSSFTASITGSILGADGLLVLGINGTNTNSIEIVKKNVWTSYVIDLTNVIPFDGILTNQPAIASISLVILRAGSDQWNYNFRNFKVSMLAEPVNERAVSFVTQASEFVTLPAPTLMTTDDPLTGCPHLQSDLQVWHDPATWPNKKLPQPTDPVIRLPKNAKVLLMASSLDPTTPYKKIVIPSTSELIFNEADIHFHIGSIVIESGGALRAGSPTCLLRSRIMVHFHKFTHGNATEAPGIYIAPNSVMSIYSKPYLPWTRLASTSLPGDDFIFTQHEVDWPLESRVFVSATTVTGTTTSTSEASSILAVGPDGKTIQLGSSLSYIHHGEPEYQAEVGVLSRRFIFGVRTANDSDSSGGFIHSDGALLQLVGVEFQMMGQPGQAPVTISSSQPGSIVSYSSFSSPPYRCIVLNNSSAVEISNNVAFNVTGSCIVLASGFEENNTISQNLVVKLNPIADPPVDSNNTVQVQVDPIDGLPAAFVILNRWNLIEGNVAVEGVIGFHLPHLVVDGVSPVTLRAANTQVFKANTAHSQRQFSGLSYSFKFGGTIEFNTSTIASTLVSPGNTVPLRKQGTILVESCKAFTSAGPAFFIDAEQSEVVSAEVIEVSHMGDLHGDSLVHHCLVIHSIRSPILPLRIHSSPVSGIQMPCGPGSNITYSDIIFRSFKGDLDCAVVDECNVLPGSIRPSSAVVLQRFHFENENANLNRIGFPSLGKSAYSVLSEDCSLWDSSTSPPCLLGYADSKRWILEPENCTYWFDGIHWLCQGIGEARPASIQLSLPQSVLPNSGGNATAWGRGTKQFLEPAVFSETGELLGLDRRGWHLSFINGAPRQIDITTQSLESSNYVIISISYPPGTTFNVTGPVKFTMASSRDQVATSSVSDPKYFFDNSFFYIRITNLPASTNGASNVVHIDATCPPSAPGWCASSVRTAPTGVVLPA